MKQGQQPPDELLDEPIIWLINHPDPKPVRSLVHVGVLALEEDSALEMLSRITRPKGPPRKGMS
jgi:hypothetical protein